MTSDRLLAAGVIRAVTEKQPRHSSRPVHPFTRVARFWSAGHLCSAVGERYLLAAAPRIRRDLAAAAWQTAACIMRAVSIWRRVAPRPVVLDPLLALPSAADTLDADLAFTPTGLGSICFRAIEVRAFRDVEYDVRDWLDSDAENTMPVEITEDSYGFTWMVIRRPPNRFQSVITDLHAASSKFADNGFGPQLLCSLAAFRDRDDRHVAIVYLYSRGTFYPFAPQPGESRNNRLELAFKDAIQGKVPLEADLRRWFPVWGAPGL